MAITARINQHLLKHGLRIRGNPAVSPDLCLDPAGLERAAAAEAAGLRRLAEEGTPGRGAPLPRAAAGRMDFFPASRLRVSGRCLFVVEERETGDAGLLVTGDALPLEGARAVGDGLAIVPLLWSNLAPLKNLLQEADPDSTVFPVARGALARASLGIGARFTTLHWPAVAWAMKELAPAPHRQPELDPARARLRRGRDARRASRPGAVPVHRRHRPRGTPGPVRAGHDPRRRRVLPEAAASIATASHGASTPTTSRSAGASTPSRTRWSGGCAFASYITFDLSPELFGRRPIDDPAELASTFASLGEEALFARVLARVRALGLAGDETAMRAAVHLRAGPRCTS